MYTARNDRNVGYEPLFRQRTTKLSEKDDNTLPPPPVTHLPNGVTFAGWLVGTPEGITSYWKGDTETVLPTGSTYVVNGDVSLTARYTGLNISLSNDGSNWERPLQQRRQGSSKRHPHWSHVLQGRQVEHPLPALQPDDQRKSPRRRWRCGKDAVQLIV